jgi:predicted nucleic acid-binding protein
MKRIFIDTGIFELYFMGINEIKTLFNKIKNETIHAYTLELNLFEYFYKICEKLGKDVAQIRNLSLRKTKIKIEEISDMITEKAASFRCSNSQLSTVDSYICACADLNSLIVYSTDSDFSDVGIKSKKFSLR